MEEMLSAKLEDAESEANLTGNLITEAARQVAWGGPHIHSIDAG